jgi:hypothetical protein
MRRAGDAQYLANMWFNLLNDIFSHTEVMVSEGAGEVFASSCAGRETA